ncbi:bifunctional apoptosis regulator isoform X1 [Lampetra fluviatilis]
MDDEVGAFAPSLPWHGTATLGDGSRTPGESDGRLSLGEMACHCCYELLLDPTTLTCGHSFCRHCLALWWNSSRRAECPECRQMWQGFPRTNIVLRGAIEKLFPEQLWHRQQEVLSNGKTAQTLAAFEQQGQEQISAANGRPAVLRQGTARSFFSGVLTALTCVAVMLLVYHWSSGDTGEEMLVHKSLSKWTSSDVGLWLEQLGSWTVPYRETFQQEGVNGRLLLSLTEEELNLPPYGIEKPAHRKALITALDSMISLGVKPPHNLWEYKAMHAGKSLFLLFLLKSSPRLAIFYLYLFDYTDLFLPLIHTCCPGRVHEEEAELFRGGWPDSPSWEQWAEFLPKAMVMPYVLVGRFAWEWLEVHYWTARFVVINAALLTLLEIFAIKRFCLQGEIRRLPRTLWNDFCRLFSQGAMVTIFWPVLPQFVCDCLFYWALYFNPIINLDQVTKEVRRIFTQEA